MSASSALLILAMGFAVGLSACLTAAYAARTLLPRSPSPPATPPSDADSPWWRSELLELTHDAVIVWEMDDGGILYWNRAAEQLYGFDREQALGKVTHQLLRTQVAGSVSGLEANLARYGIWVGEMRHTARDGKPIVVEGRLTLLSQINARWLVLEVNRDLTDQARAAAASSAREDRLLRLRGLAPQVAR